MATRRPASKAPTRVDLYIGVRIRDRRKEVGLSQERLGEHIGVSFQQMQKYESGTNRIGPSRLVQVAEALKVPLTYFFPDEANAISRPPDPQRLKRTLRPLLKQLRTTLDQIEEALDD